MVKVIARRALLCVTLAYALLPCSARAGDSSASIVVFAAASLTDAMQELGRDYTNATGTKVEMSFAASSILARQVEGGAQTDIFLSADAEWMDYLDQRGLIQRSTRHELVGNRLVLVAPADSTLQLKIQPGFPLLAALRGGRLATADPDSVPLGRYARAALSSLGVWNQMADHLVRADNARGALAFVASGEAPLGIVYRTEALIEKRVRIVDLFPATTHPRIAYQVALTTTGNAKAAAFVRFLQSASAGRTFERYGFTILH